MFSIVFILINKQTAEMVANEFFEQGDLEKERLNVTPAVGCIFRLFLFVLHEKTFFSSLTLRFYQYCSGQKI